MRARALPVTELEGEVAVYLNGSRYCETDKMSSPAWSNFGHLAPDTHMVQAICDFAHERLTFDYTQARSTRTAVEAYEEKVGVCRDFIHLAVTLCRMHEHPGALRERLPRRHWCATQSLADGFQRLV